MVAKFLCSCKYLFVVAMAASLLSRDAMFVRAVSSALILGFRTFVS
jgi:hypothetical protein